METPVPTLTAGLFPPLRPHIFPCKSTESSVGLPELHNALPTEVPPRSPLLQCRTQSWNTAPHFSCSLPVIRQK